MANILQDEAKKIFLLGIGAVAATAEKSQEIVDELVKKGEITVDEGKSLNQELKHKIDEKKNAKKDENTGGAEKKEDASDAPVSDADVADFLAKLSPEQLAALKKQVNDEA